MKILIAEDELVSRKKLERLVAALGNEPITAENGKEALKIWKSQRPPMIITDWNMPEMDGLELTKEIRRLQGSRYVFIVMVTSKDSVEDLITGMEAGADDFIVKPYIKEELAVRIRAGERILHFETRDIVIFSMANLAEARDPETGNHLERIRFYSKTLAESLAASKQALEEITPDYIENILLTSPLHDIGKIGIPDFVLLKPGRLDDREFSIMKCHTTIGYQALNAALNKYPHAEYLRMSADIALYHHEKFDGSGYPADAGDEGKILEAQILSVADSFDAMTSQRAYKKEMDVKTALCELRNCLDTQFDNKIMLAFCKVLDKEIKGELPDPDIIPHFDKGSDLSLISTLLAGLIEELSR
jgi:putative two-component system response regulator